MSNKDIKVVKGNGSELNISKVSEHLKAVKPKGKVKGKDIVIPKGKK